MPLLFGHDKLVADYVGERMGGLFVFPHIAIGMLDKRGTLRGGFVLAVHNMHTVELSIYSDDVITNGMVRGFFEWAFLQVGAHRIQIRTTRKNASVKRAAPKMGFRFEGVARDFYGPGEDALLYYMTPDNCRWINGKFIQKSEGTPAVGREAVSAGHRRAKPAERLHRERLQPA